MAKLWAKNTRYDASKPQSFGNMPYERLYENLTPEELAELLRDAKARRWEVLDLCSCRLSNISDTLGELEDLRYLDIGSGVRSIRGDENVFTKLPDSIGNLTNLQLLYLDSSKIIALPDSIGNLKKLRKLDLRETRISALPGSIGNLTSLQWLDLHGTQISALPDSIGNLKKLRKLDLCNCHLQEISYGVVSLGLPFVIDDKWTEGDCVNLTNVTLDEGDLSLFTQPQDVIEAYYRKQTQIRECKVIFLGDGGAGKTALIKRITQGTFTLETPPTDGIETTNWFMSVEMTKWEDLAGDAPFILRFLDFGEQEIMCAAHRCFLTAHTIYVVVCDSRDDQKIDDIAL